MRIKISDSAATWHSRKSYGPFIFYSRLHGGLRWRRQRLPGRVDGVAEERLLGRLWLPVRFAKFKSGYNSGVTRRGGAVLAKFSLQLSRQFLFIFVFSIQLTVSKYKICQWLDSNRGPLVLEATALPTEPQPLPFLLACELIFYFLDYDSLDDLWLVTHRKNCFPYRLM